MLAKFKKFTVKQWWAVGAAGLVALIALAVIVGMVNKNLNTSNSTVQGITAPGYYEAAPAYKAMPAPTQMISGAGSSGGVAAGAPAYASTTDTATSTYNVAQPQQAVALPADRMVIRNATISVRSKEVEKTVLDLRALATEKNGTVSQSNINVNSDNLSYGTIVLQVPSNSFDDVMNRIRKVENARVDSENVSSQDVTEEYVDVQAQVKNLKVTEEELQRLLGKANSVSEIMTVQRELSNVRSQIERWQGRMNYLEKRTAMSTITINLAPWTTPTKMELKSWNFGQVAEDAWEGSLQGLQGLATIGVTLLAWGVWLLPVLALIFFVGRFVRRRTFRKNDKKNASAFAD